MYKTLRPMYIGIAAPVSAGGLLSNAQAAEVYKCTNAFGRVEFTDAPCGTERKSSVVDARPNSLDNSSVREQLLKIENRSSQDKLAATQPTPATSMQGQSDSTRADSAGCRSAKRDAEIAATVRREQPRPDPVTSERDVHRVRRSRAGQASRQHQFRQPRRSTLRRSAHIDSMTSVRSGQGCHGFS